MLAVLPQLQDLLGPRLAFVDAGAEADLRLAVIPDSPRPDAIWVLPATGIVEDYATTPSIATGDKDAEALVFALDDTLSKMSRALNLMKLGGAIGGSGGGSGGDGGLRVEVAMMTRNAENPTLSPLAFTSVPTLVTNDEVHVLARNNSDQPIDVNVLYVGADYSITHWAAERLQPGDELKRGLFAIGGEAMGQERMIVVVSPAKPKTPVENLDFLAQDALELTKGIGDEPSRSVGEDGASGPSMADMLSEAGFGESTRGAVPLGGGGDGEAAKGPAPIILQMELRTRAVD